MHHETKIQLFSWGLKSKDKTVTFVLQNHEIYLFMICIYILKIFTIPKYID